MEDAALSRVRHLSRHLAVSGVAGDDSGMCLAASVVDSHVCLSAAHAAALFGPAHVAGPVDTVAVVNPVNGKQMQGVRVVSCSGDCDTQVTMTFTDCRRVAIEPPTRADGDASGSAGCTLAGPAGNVTLSEGLIRAWRSVHMGPQQAARCDVVAGTFMSVKVNCPMSSMTLNDVIVVVDSAADTGAGSPMRLLLDTDEGHACMLPDAVSFDLYRQGAGSAASPFGPAVASLEHVLCSPADGNVEVSTAADAVGAPPGVFTRPDQMGRDAQPRLGQVRFGASSITAAAIGAPGTGGGLPASSGGAGGGAAHSLQLAIDVSNRHVHLSKDALRELFGEGATLTVRKPLYGLPMALGKFAQFAAEETVTVREPVTGRQLTGVRVLGPCRELTQVELAYTDCRALGIEAPTRMSGDSFKSGPCLLLAEGAGAGSSEGSGSARQLPSEEGVIRAWRHIHMTPMQSAAIGVSEGDLMTVHVHSNRYSVMLHDLLTAL